MSDLNLTRIKLLSQSKNRLLAAEAGNWQQLEALDRIWNDLIKKSFDSFGERLNDVIPELEKDNEQLIKIVKKAQTMLMDDLQKESSGFKKIQHYLK